MVKRSLYVIYIYINYISINKDGKKVTIKCKCKPYMSNMKVSLKEIFLKEKIYTLY